MHFFIFLNFLISLQILPLLWSILFSIKLYQISVHPPQIVTNYFCSHIFTGLFYFIVTIIPYFLHTFPIALFQILHPQSQFVIIIICIRTTIIVIVVRAFWGYYCRNLRFVLIIEMNWSSSFWVLLCIVYMVYFYVI